MDMIFLLDPTRNEQRDLYDEILLISGWGRKRGSPRLNFPGGALFNWVKRSEGRKSIRHFRDLEVYRRTFDEAMQIFEIWVNLSEINYSRSARTFLHGKF